MLAFCVVKLGLPLNLLVVLNSLFDEELVLPRQVLPMRLQPLLRSKQSSARKQCFLLLRLGQFLPVAPVDFDFAFFALCFQPVT